MAQAKINVICETCGKEFTHTKVCYNRKEADSYEEWAKENITVCPDCYKTLCRKAEEKKRRKALTGNIMRRAWKIAREGAEKFGGSPREYFKEALRMAWAEIKSTTAGLTGSAKQIAWAKQIVESAMSELLVALKPEFAEQAIAAARKQTSASWWIDKSETIGFASPKRTAKIIYTA